MQTLRQTAQRQVDQADESSAFARVKAFTVQGLSGKGDHGQGTILMRTEIFNLIYWYLNIERETTK